MYDVRGERPPFRGAFHAYQNHKNKQINGRRMKVRQLIILYCRLEMKFMYLLITSGLWKFILCFGVYIS